MSGEIDSSGGGSLKERLAKLRLSQEQSANGQFIPAPNGKYRPILSGTVSSGGSDRTYEKERLSPSVLPPSNAIPPPLPSRSSSNSRESLAVKTVQVVSQPNQVTAPPLPMRRKSSGSSLASISSTGSINGVPGRPLPPPYMGKEFLPVQFPEKGSKKIDNQRDKRVQTPNVNGYAKIVIPPHNGVVETKVETMKIIPPNLPPKLPPRRPASRGEHNKEVNLGFVGTMEKRERREGQVEQQARRRLPPPPPPPSEAPKNNIPPTPPPVPDVRPPPIPISTRPSALSFTAGTTNLLIKSNGANGTSRTTKSCLPCLKCYDFSVPDTLAASPHLSRTVVPSIAYLAHELTSPFDTIIEKARAIFTWMHHNIAYDVHSFFNNCVKGQSAMETLRSGAAVCSGYSGLFEEIVMAGVGFNHSGGRNKQPVLSIGGFGKGYGYTYPGPNAPLPELTSNHAWNAILLEDGTYHLLDCCWGAGHVSGPESSWPNGRYNKSFDEEVFIAGPEEFGKKHFPMKSEHQFRVDGKIIDFGEFINGERGDPLRGLELAKTYTCLGKRNDGFGFDEQSLLPRQRYLNQGPNNIYETNKIITFSISKPCPHVTIDEAKEGIYFIAIEGVNDPAFPLVRRGATWSVTVDASKLKGENGRMVDLMKGGSGKDGRRIVWLCHLIKLDGRDARGMKVEEWLRLRGRVGMSWGYMVEWNGRD